MIIGDICGHSVDWNQNDILRLRCQLILKLNNKPKDPLCIFLDKISYECFTKKSNKINISECKQLKRRLNGLIKKWHKNKIKEQILEFISLLERCINNRRCLYIYKTDLKLVI
jgi:hypothetical protein